MRYNGTALWNPPLNSYKYNPLTNTITTLTPPPKIIFGSASCLIDGNIYSISETENLFETNNDTTIQVYLSRFR